MRVETETPVKVKEVPVYINPKTVEDLVAETKKAFENLQELCLKCHEQNIKLSFITKTKHKSWNSYSTASGWRDPIPEFMYMPYPITEYNIKLTASFTKEF